MVKAQAYTIKGTKTEEQTLPKEVFEVKPNPNLLAQAVHVYAERSHIGLRNTKTRSEVNRTTKKLYAQKGTGGARHGSRRAPIFVGGGISHGPRAVRRVVGLSSALKSKAKAYAFSVKAAAKEIVVLENVSKVSKAKEFGNFAKGIGAKRTTFVLSDASKDAFRFLRNLSGSRAFLYKEINALDILNGGTLILDAAILSNQVKAKGQEVREIKKIEKKSVKKVVKTTK